MAHKSMSDDRAEKAIDRDRALRLAAEAETIPARDPRRIAASVAMLERLAEHWSLRGDERETLLGGIPKSTWSEWRQRPALARIKPDTRERIANLFTIDLNAHALFAPEFADRWVREPNSAFGDESPMSTMLHGKLEDVITVRRYLERIRSSSATDTVRPDRAPAEMTLGVSYLPGEAVEVGDEGAAILALRQAVAIYEQLALREPARYRPALEVALGALGTGLEDRDSAEAAALLRRAFEIRIQLTSERPTQMGTSDDLHGAKDDGAWRTLLERTAQSAVALIGRLDESFSPALLARLREIERDPFQSPMHRELDKVRVADLTHNGITWILSYVVSEPARCIYVISIEAAPSGAIPNSASQARAAHGVGTDR